MNECADENTNSLELLLKWSVQALALPADVQRSIFPDFVSPADELAIDFDFWWRRYQEYLEYSGQCISKDQRKVLEALDNLLDKMSGPRKPQYWVGDKCLDHPKWSEVRRLAKDALEVWGWPMEIPPKRNLYANRSRIEFSGGADPGVTLDNIIRAKAKRKRKGRRN